MSLLRRRGSRGVWVFAVLEQGVEAHGIGEEWRGDPECARELCSDILRATWAVTSLRIDLELNGPCTCLDRDMLSSSSLAWWHTPCKVAIVF